MKTRLRHITSTAITLTSIALVCMLAPHAKAVTYTWDGNGDADNGGNWSDPLNWVGDSGTPSTTSDVAFLPYPTVDRYVTNDVAVTIDQLALATGSKNRLVLGADLKVRLTDVTSDAGHPGSLIRLNGYTYSVDQGNIYYHPGLGGDGTLVKYGTSQVTLQLEDPITYTGSMIASNGVLFFRAHLWDTTTLLTVIDGATAELNGPNPKLPTNIVVSGQGFNGDGALEFSGNALFNDSTITLAADAKFKNSSSAANTMTLSGNIIGTDELTLQGPGAFLFSASSYSFSGALSITSGTTVVAGILPSVTNVIVRNGGTLIGTASRFPSTIVGSVTNVTVETGGTWIEEAAGVWDGNGNANNGGNWSDAANWTADEVPTYLAILPKLSVNRSVTNDVASSVTILQLEDDSQNRLVVMAPMNVRTYEPRSTAGYFSQVDNYSTMTISNHTSGYSFDSDKGNGTYVVVGAGQYTAQSAGTFSGNWIISNGTFFVRSAPGYNWSSVTVEDGATANFNSGTTDATRNITISGSGKSPNGALRNGAGTRNFSNLVVAVDATVEAATQMNFVSGGTISGPGDLTKLGANTLNLDGTYNVAISGAAANKMIASAGTIDITDATLNVTGEFTASEEEYPIIDYSGAGSVSGQFGATNDLENGWVIDYNGTILNPNAVVLIPPSGLSPGTVIYMR